jgi:protein-disulfide isomerase
MTGTSWGSTLVLPVVPERDHMRGPLNAPVALVEYGDYECPFCAAAHPVVNAVRHQLGDDLQFVYRHFPITTVHPHARQAAEAAEAAGAQHRFWPMHDLLYADNTRLAFHDLLARAEVLGLDLNALEASLHGNVFADRLQEDFISGVRSGVSGTPTFFINGMRYDGPPDSPGLSTAVRRVLSRLDPAPLHLA